MPRSRLKLDAILREITKNVYFQSPGNQSLKYPCILYEKADEWNQYADNMKYNRMNAYDITVMTKDPDSKIPDCVGNLPLCTFNRYYASENINHYVYRIYF